MSRSCAAISAVLCSAGNRPRPSSSVPSMSTAIKRIMKEGICSKVHQYAKSRNDRHHRLEQTGRFKGAAVHRWRLVAQVVLIQHIDRFNKECQPAAVPAECPVHANVESRVSRDAQRIAFRML